MKFGVIVFPGSNCDDDMVYVLADIMGHEAQKIWHKDSSLKGWTTDDCLIVPGGFSFGDYLRSGAIAQFSPIMQHVKAFAERGGKVFGICNGFQILCEIGLLPGVLMRNNNQKYISKSVPLRTETTNSSVTNKLKLGQVIHIPIAHGDGRYYCSEQVLGELESNDQILFRYCNDSGEIGGSNPNGSIADIAGICNRERNVFGMMPHPERAAEELIGNTDGLSILMSLLKPSIEVA